MSSTASTQSTHTTEDNWHIEDLLSFAKTVDRTRERQPPQERIYKRKLAFEARKRAQEKAMNN